MAEEEKSFFNKMQEYLSTFGDRSDEVKEQDNPEQGVYAAPFVKQDNQVDYSKISYGDTLDDANLNLEIFSLPITASGSDIKVGENDAGFPVFRSRDGSTYTVMPKQDQRTTLSKIKEDVIPAVKEYADNPFLPTGKQVVDTTKAVAGSIYDTVSIPGDVVSGKKNLSDVTYGDALEIASTGGAMSTLGKAPAGSLRMFGGANANAPITKGPFSQAEKMSNKGAGPQDTWKETGWWLDDADGKWRFEIDDSQASLPEAMMRTGDDDEFLINSDAAYNDNWSNPDSLEFDQNGPKPLVYDGEYNGEYNGPGSSVWKMSDLLKHDKLFKNYPELKDRAVVLDAQLEPDVGGSYNPDTGVHKISSAVSDPEEIRSVLLHEIQHAIQQREGMGPGTNVSSASTFNTNKLLKNRQEVYDSLIDYNVKMPELKFKNNTNFTVEFEAALKNQNLNLPVKIKQDAIKKFKKINDELYYFLREENNASKEFYFNENGEIEARLTEARKDMDQNEREFLSPIVQKINTIRDSPIAKKRFSWPYNDSTAQNNFQRNPTYARMTQELVTRPNVTDIILKVDPEYDTNAFGKTGGWIYEGKKFQDFEEVLDLSIRKFLNRTKDTKKVSTIKPGDVFKDQDGEEFVFRSFRRVTLDPLELNPVQPQVILDSVNTTLDLNKGPLDIVGANVIRLDGFTKAQRLDAIKFANKGSMYDDVPATIGTDNNSIVTLGSMVFDSSLSKLKPNQTSSLRQPIKEKPVNFLTRTKNKLGFSGDRSVNSSVGLNFKDNKESLKIKEPFDLKALATAAKQNDASREILVEMPIDDFLKAAKKEISPEKLAGTRELVKSGTPFNSIPYLSFKNIGDGTGEVVGHEGRHRAIALKEAGETTIPVRLMSQGSKTGSSIRWGKQNDPTDMDYVEVLPTKLIEEEGKSIISMPKIAANIRKSKQFAEGGSVDNMTKQMRMFEEGGIADDGLDRDPISGNEIPSGSLAKEVRDDIPAQLSEGEYVVPADVVRFFGVKYFEDLRMEAKQGLQTMEQNGRIGGEPTMSQAMPQGNQGSITDEDLAQIEQMFASGVANGGLMDKVAYVAANDPIINRAFNKGGAVVSFAVGGSVQSPFNDPTKVDAVIGKFMQMVQSKPQIMEELSKRGIQVTRTGANQQPQQIQRDNSASQTTEPVMEGKPTPTPEPIRASAGLLAGNTGYIKSPTMVLPAGFKSGYNVPGQSLTYTGPGVPGSTETTPAPAVPVSSGVPAAPVGTPVCPPGQEYDSVAQMCVPRQDYDGSKKDKPPEPPNYDNFMKQYGEVDFSDPEAMKKYIEDVSKPSEFSGALGALSMIPNGIGAIIGGIGSAGQVNSYAELKVAELHAIASGDDELLAIAKAGQTKFLAESGKFVNSKLGQFFGGDGAGALKARYANVLEGSGLNLDEVDDWNDTQRKKYKDLTSSKKTKVKVAKKVEAAAILANNSGQIQPRTGDSEQNQGGSTSDQLSNFGVKVTTAPKKDPNYTYVKPTVQVDEPDDYGYEDAMYKGGLIARPKKKKKK